MTEEVSMRSLKPAGARLLFRFEIFARDACIFYATSGGMTAQFLADERCV